MATSLLALLDDIATVLDDIAVLTKVAARKAAVVSDDVAVMTKVAAQKTAGVLGDDLALNAQQVSGVAAPRELPVVWQVAKGSLVNKAILVPAALAISAFAPWAITPLLMVGGAFLAYEGFEKVAHKLLHPDDAGDAAHEAELARAAADPTVDIAALEKQKIRGAIRTDFILSAEIIVISLGTVGNAPFLQRLMVLTAIALVMTVGVYGLVAGIVKLDDIGFWLMKRPAALARSIGRALVAAAPKLMRVLAVVGTLAMFLVGGGIVMHGWPWVHHLVQGWQARIDPSGGLLGDVVGQIGALATGVVVGAALVAVVEAFKRMRGKPAPSAA